MKKKKKLPAPFRMLTQGCTTLFKAQLEISTLVTASPYHWSKKNGRGKLFYTPPDSCYSAWYIRLLMLWVYTGFLVCRLLYTLSKGSVELVDVFEFLMWLTAYLAGCVAGIILILRPDELCQLVNSTLDYSRQNISYQNTQKNSTLHYCLIFLIIAANTIPLILPLIFWFVPCAPQFSYSLVSTTCANSGYENASKGRIYSTQAGIKAVFYSLEVFLISPVTAYAGIIGNVILIGLISLNYFLKHLR